MKLFLMIAATLLISTYSAPTTEYPLNSPEDETQVTEDSTTEFWLLNPLKNINQIILPEEDKKILCDFLASFRIIKMQLFGAIFTVNMEFMKNVENKFIKDFKQYQEKHPNKDNKTQLQEFIGVGVDPFKIYHEDSEYKKKFYQDIGKIYQGRNEHFIKESQKIKGKVSQETAKNEEEFFEKFKGFEEPSKKYYNDKSELINNIEEEYEYKYQCEGEE